ncbi:MAG: dihydrodipicolinate reductase [Pseudomonadota bacterium]
MHGITALLIAGLAVAGTAAHAEFAKIDRVEDFISVVQGKELRRPLINVEVLTDGEISGEGAGWPVTGQWTWRDGYFCRDLFWGGDELGYNCQQVDVRGENWIRFTSDRGAGRSAEFRLR